MTIQLEYNGNDNTYKDNVANSLNTMLVLTASHDIQYDVTLK